MTTYIETYHNSEIILSEADGTLSREVITVVSGTGILTAGTVIGKITATGKWRTYDDAHADGSQATLAILLESIDATGSDIVCSALVRFAEVKKDILQWDTACDATAKTAAYAALIAPPSFIAAR